MHHRGPNGFLFHDIMKPNALPWRVDRKSDGAILGWFSHQWKAVRAARRGFGGLEAVTVKQVPGDEFAAVWRLL